MVKLTVLSMILTIASPALAEDYNLIERMTEDMQQQQWMEESIRDGVDAALDDQRRTEKSDRAWEEYDKKYGLDQYR